jgi:hypothetical protein
MTDTAGSGSSGYAALIGAVLGQVAEAGSWLTAHERVAAASLSRDRNVDVVLRPEMAEAAIRMAHEPTKISESWVAELETRGLGRVTMAEVLGVISRQVAIDTFMFGVGAEQTELPTPNPGAPSKVIVDGSKLEKGFLPTVGPASPHTAFTSVPPAQAALEELSAGLYLPMEQIRDFAFTRDGMSRTQMEVVAARTSFLNDCFY